MLLARLIEPTSKADTPGSCPRSAGWPRPTATPCRPVPAAASGGPCSITSPSPTGGLALCLETEQEDDLRRVGCSRERWVGPQVIVDLHGLPLQVGCWEGDRVETTTIPVVEAFQAAQGIDGLVVAGWLLVRSSASDLTALDEAGLRLIVGARQVRDPRPPCTGWATPPPTSGRPGTITPGKAQGASGAGASGPNSSGTRTLTRARAVIAGEKRPRTTRFVTTHAGDAPLDGACLARARSLVELKVSSPGFCGGSVSWFRWWPVAVVPGGRCRGPGRPRARPGCACRWRSGDAPCCTSGPTGRWRARHRRCPPRGPCCG